MAVPNISSKEFITSVNDEVNRLMASLEKIYKSEPKSSVPLRFADILGATDNDYWWRLYINPKDWDEALRHGDPRNKYNEDKEDDKYQPKGFRQGMTNSYQKYLINGVLSPRLSPGQAPITMQEYLQLFDDTKPHMIGGQKEFSDNPATFAEYPHFRGEQADPTTYGAPDEFAPDVWTVKYTITRKAGPVTIPLLGKDKADAFVRRYTDTKATYAQATGSDLTGGVTAVFVNLKKEVDAAALHYQQLEAIARAIRSLHMMHAFTNGCGRTNVFALLPMLLLQHGFGLPLGGERGGTVSRYAIDQMFNGGYTAEQMARFLYVTQDLGLVYTKGNVLQVSSCLGARGERPIPPGH